MVEDALGAETLAEAISSKKAEDTSVVSIHSGDLLHKCDDCWECFERSQLLMEHRGVEHKVVKRFKSGYILREGLSDEVAVTQYKLRKALGCQWQLGATIGVPRSSLEAPKANFFTAREADETQ